MAGAGIGGGGIGSVPFGGGPEKAGEGSLVLPKFTISATVLIARVEALSDAQLPALTINANIKLTRKASSSLQLPSLIQVINTPQVTRKFVFDLQLPGFEMDAAQKRFYYAAPALNLPSLTLSTSGVREHKVNIALTFPFFEAFGVVGDRKITAEATLELPSLETNVAVNPNWEAEVSALSLPALRLTASAKRKLDQGGLTPPSLPALLLLAEATVYRYVTGSGNLVLPAASTLDLEANVKRQAFGSGAASLPLPEIGVSMNVVTFH